MSSNSYEPQQIENKFYKIWEERKYFEVDGNKAIQKEGKAPSFSYLAKIINLAKQQNIKTVIISPEFPTKYAKIVANKINAKVVVISPLNESPTKTINQLIEALK